MNKVTDKQKRRLYAKSKKLAYQQEHLKAGTKTPKVREVHVKCIAGPNAMMFSTRTGLYSPRSGPTYTLSDLEIAECLDRPQYLVQVCSRLGFAVLSQVLRLNAPAKGIEALKGAAETAAAWMGIDVVALKAELAEMQAEEDAKTAAAEVDAIQAEQLNLPLEPVAEVGGEA